MTPVLTTGSCLTLTQAGDLWSLEQAVTLSEPVCGLMIIGHGMLHDTGGDWTMGKSTI